MGVLTESLRIIRGYDIVNIGDKYYKNYVLEPDYISLYFSNVNDAIYRCLNTLNRVLYQDVDISAELGEISTHKYARRLRTAIYNAVKKLSIGAGINLGIQLAQIKNAHFGSDMREPLYDALIKLGAEGDMYYQTTAEDYIWRKESGNVILVRYLTTNHPYIITPQTIDDSPVVDISAFTFDSHEELIGVRIPSGTIYI